MPRTPSKGHIRRTKDSAGRESLSETKTHRDETLKNTHEKPGWLQSRATWYPCPQLKCLCSPPGTPRWAPQTWSTWRLAVFGDCRLNQRQGGGRIINYLCHGGGLKQSTLQASSAELGRRMITPLYFGASTPRPQGWRICLICSFGLFYLTSTAI